MGGGKKFHIECLLNVLNDMVDRAGPQHGSRHAPCRFLVSTRSRVSVMSSPVASSKVVVKPGEDVVFLPTHTSSNPCGGKVFTVEMHHKRVEAAAPGDNVGMNIKGLDKLNMPRTGDVMMYKKDTSLAPCKEFTAQVQTLDIPGELKAGYSPIGFVRCGRSACKMTALNFKVGKETGGKKLEGPADAVEVQRSRRGRL